MKKILLGLLIVILIILGVYYHNNTSATRIISKLTSQKNFKLGQLKYRIYFSGLIPMADAIFEPEQEVSLNNNKFYYLAMKAQLLKRYHKLYKVSVEMSSFLDKKTLLPGLYEYKLMMVNKKDVYEKVEYDRIKNFLLVNGGHYSISANMRDPISAFYYLTHSSLKQDDRIDLDLYTTNLRSYTLNGKINEKILRVNNKDYNLIISDIKINSGEANYNKVKIKITMVRNQDKENIPILIDIFSKGVNLKVKLIDIL